MNIIFKDIKLYNFGSYHEAELDLSERGFCLVQGKNEYHKDNAQSNGSGKSFIWNAICYALTGETLIGIKSGLKNLYFTNEEMSVTLNFAVDGDKYQIIRGVKENSSQKFIFLYKNAEDISGKTFTETQDKLTQILPDITKNLIASTIILGQGLPLKFSSHSPKARKELLEELTKSDFMFNDIKDRIDARKEELSVQMRSYEDSLLVNQT